MISGPPGCLGGTFTTNNPMKYPNAANDPDAIFTGDAGVYELQWEVGGCTDTVLITLTTCNTIDFDGQDDHINFKDNYNLNTAFSIEVWIKPELNNNQIQTIFSKRNANPLNGNGYDLRLTNKRISFNWNNGGSIISNYNIDTNRWYHVAVTFNGSEYKLYIDGIEAATPVSGSAPVTNNFDCLLGAMANTGKPLNYFNGWIDELRIWRKALHVEHIRQMMNQQIISSSIVAGNIQGEIIPLDIYGPDANQDGNDDDSLIWNNLEGYYRMDNIGCGNLLPYNNVGVNGKLKNINSSQPDSAPLPYTTISNGDWKDVSPSTPWTYGNSVWNYPNSQGVNGSPIDWNIVETSHNIKSGNNDITLLGLHVKSGELTVLEPSQAANESNPGRGLWITKYLKLDGLIDLVGESQLVQKRYSVNGNPTIQLSESILDASSTGTIERDQQGQSNKFNYNYWSSPVTPSIGGNYNVASVLFDGTDTNNPVPLKWTDSYDANPATVGKTLSRRWIYTYENSTSNIYANWRYVRENNNIKPGLSFTMKGSGNSGNEQNYVFIGKPNNGTIISPINKGNEALVGNPYPSAIDANEFIFDNIPGGNPGTSGSIDGTLYYWIHFNTNNTHILRDYQGGYALYNLSGGVKPVVSPLLTDDGFSISGLGSTNLKPERYVPVGQGFFVSAILNPTGGNITFKNSQRVFETEQGANSIFLKPSKGKSKSNNSSTVSGDNMKRMRFKFKTPEGARRDLLLAFTPDNKATDGFDFGYDAVCNEIIPNDMLFTIDNKNYIIQGVGDFNDTKQYPFGIFTKTGGNFEISLTDMENLSPNTKVYIYDAKQGTYNNINNEIFKLSLEKGNYLNRFYITFKTNETLDIIDELSDLISVNYLQNSHEIHIQTPNDIEIKQVYLLNILGQTVKSWNKTNTPVFSNDMKILVNNISEGSYIIKVVSNKGISNKKVVINQ